MAADPVRFDRSVAVLLAYSLVSRDADDITLSIHRLVQVVLRDALPEQEQAVWVQRVIAAMNTVFPSVEYRTWKDCERLLSHVLACAKTIPDQAHDLRLVTCSRKRQTI